MCGGLCRVWLTIVHLPNVVSVWSPTALQSAAILWSQLVATHNHNLTSVAGPNTLIRLSRGNPSLRHEAVGSGKRALGARY